MAKAGTKTAVVESKKTSEFKLPKYLRLAKGAMWFDIEGDSASGVKLYAVDKVFIGRGLNDKVTAVPRDKFDNNNFVEYGYIEKKFDESTWYVDTTAIPSEKQSRLILAFKHGILVEADIKNPPKPPKEIKQAKDFQRNKSGDMVFIGKNKDIFQKLQNLTVGKLREFVNGCPKTETVKNNLIDMFHYEQLGYNRLARPRLEVLDLVRAKLKEFGPTMSAIRVNEDK